MKLKQQQCSKLLVIATVLCLSLLTASLAFANTSNGTEFQPLYDRVIQWMTGLPAIIAAIGIVLGSVLTAHKTGNYLLVMGGILIAALIFVLPPIIQGLGGTTIG